LSTGRTLGGLRRHRQRVNLPTGVRGVSAAIQLVLYVRVSVGLPVGTRRQTKDGLETADGRVGRRPYYDIVTAAHVNHCQRRAYADRTELFARDVRQPKDADDDVDHV